MIRSLATLALFAALASTAAAQTPAHESQLCRAQLELLLSGNKLTEAERAVFEAQCSCLEQQEQGGEEAQSCAQER